MVRMYYGERDERDRERNKKVPKGIYYNEIRLDYHMMDQNY